MEITKFKTEIIRLTHIIPIFLDTTDTIDNAIWNNMRYINEILLQLLSSKVLRENSVMIVIEQFENELDLIMDISDNKVDFIIDYYKRLLEYILVKCLDNEMYESATNIRNFDTEYKNRYQF